MLSYGTVVRMLLAVAAAVLLTLCLASWLDWRAPTPGVLGGQTGSRAAVSLAGSDAAAGAPIDVTYYELNLRLDPALRSVSGTARVIARVTHSTRTFPLQLAPTMRVDSVRVAGRAVRSSHAGDVLRIML